MGAIKPRTCCQTHGDVCGFGRDHVWAGPFLLDGGRETEAGKWSQPGDLKCANCGGVCIADRDPMTANPLDEIAARSANTRLCQQADCDRRECQTGKDRAVLIAALRAVEAVSVKYQAVFDAGEGDVVFAGMLDDLQVAIREALG